MSERPKGTTLVFVALGSNIDPVSNLKAAVRALAARCRLVAVSRTYETAPVGRPDQPYYLNAAVLVETTKSAVELKDRVLRAIEVDLGRVRTADKYAPRTIDLDIVLFGDQVLEVGGRHVPDPDLLRHAHVAVPVAELDPEYIHPEAGQTLCEIAASTSRDGLVVRADVVLGPLAGL